eukprot:6192949-Pleurochrysis_carterae.AAC.1
MAALTKTGRSSAAGACVLWNERGTPFGRYVWTKCVMYFSCEVGDGSFVLNVPAGCEVGGELVVERAGAVMGIPREEVVHVAP